MIKTLLIRCIIIFAVTMIVGKNETVVQSQGNLPMTGSQAKIKLGRGVSKTAIVFG